MKEVKYTRKINIPHYKPKNKIPRIDSLVCTEVQQKLLQNINRSNVPEEVKDFLILAQARHNSFNYSKIADFYQHSSPEIKELFEESGLVIIDYDDAIKNGFFAYQKELEKDIEEMEKQEW